MKSGIRKYLTVVAAFTLCAGLTQAAPITWGAATDMTGSDNDVINGTESYNGTIYQDTVFAHASFDNNTDADLQLDGVTWTMGLPATSHSGITYAAADANEFNVGSWRGVWKGGQYATVSDDYMRLTSHMMTVGPTAEAQGTMTLTGLTAGDDYMVQIFTVDPNQWGAHRTQVITDGGANSVTLDVNDIDGWDGIGQWVAGTFTADGTGEQTITVLGDNDDGTSGSHTFISGIQLRAIPEPATFGLVAAFGGAVLFIRRRFMM